MSNEHPTGVDVVVASQTLGTTVRHTPLDFSPRLSSLRGQPVYLKREDQQVGRSYKVRGAYNFISSLNESQRKAGVVCASAGNHAQGVAFACRHLRIHGKIFLPSTTPKQKRDRIADIGGTWIEQIIGGSTFDEAAAASLTYAEEHGATYVHPFDAPLTIAGQGTVVKEIFEQADEEPASVVVPVGGGGLLAGTATWLRTYRPHVKIIGVEPAGAPSMTEALKAGRPVKLPEIDVFADGTAVAQVGSTTYDIAEKLVDEVITVPEGALCTEMLELYQVDGIITEPSGALASTAVARFLPDLPEGPIACVISGGNNDVSRYDEIIERSKVYEGLRHYFLVTFPQEAGMLRHFVSEVLGEGDDIIFFEYVKKNNRDTGPALVGIEIEKPENLNPLLSRMDASPLNIEKLDPDSPTFAFLL
ncbi:MAG: threonine ammonia-lyase IlvA [Actinomycetaceae bacterium]|nr:threonine ammonia-lyase IlvA [Actinomycetaceae bacterium]